MSKNVTQQLIESHLVEGRMKPGEEIGLKIDQTLTRDATGTLVMLEFEALGIPRARTELSAQYVDHNLFQEDFKSPDDHLFLRSACKRFVLWYSRSGSGVSQSRLRKFEQDDKWSFCLTAGTMGPRIRRDHEQTTAPEPHTGLQGKGGARCRQGRPDDSPTGRAL